MTDRSRRTSTPDAILRTLCGPTAATCYANQDRAGPLNLRKRSGAEGNRTPDICLAKAALCQLSYSPGTGWNRRGAVPEPSS